MRVQTGTRSNQPGPLTDLSASGIKGIVFSASTVAATPGFKGAYVLLFHLPHSVAFSRKQISETFPRGWYAYAGSANGPGGIGARLRRHFRRNKKRHWHIDDLTTQADEIHALAVEDGLECTLAAGLGQSGAFIPVADGFGASDCMNCQTHLLAWVESNSHQR